MVHRILLSVVPLVLLAGVGCSSDDADESSVIESSSSSEVSAGATLPTGPPNSSASPGSTTTSTAPGSTSAPASVVGTTAAVESDTSVVVATAGESPAVEVSAGCVSLPADLITLVLEVSDNLNYDEATCAWVVNEGESIDVMVLSDFQSFPTLDDAAAEFDARLEVPAGYVIDDIERLADAATAYHSVPGLVGKEQYGMIVRCGNTVLSFTLEYPLPQVEVRPEARDQLLALFHDTEPSRCYPD